MLRLNTSLVVLAVLAGLAQRSIAQSPSKMADPQVVAARTRYQFDRWPSGERHAGVPLRDLTIAGFQGGEVEAVLEPPLQRTFRDAQGRDRFLVEASVMESAALAHEQLVASIAFVSTSRTLPTAEAAGVPVGDVGFVGWSGAGPDRIAWLAFARGNVFVRVVCLDARGDLYPDMAKIVRAVDAAIKATPVVLSGAEVPRPSLRSFTLEKGACVAGEVLRLDLVASDAAGELSRTAPAVQWIVGGPGQGYVENDKDGAPRLHTTGPGKITVTAVVLGAMGTSASASVTVEVADD